MKAQQKVALHAQLTAAVALARQKRDTLTAILDAVGAPAGDVCSRVEWLANEVVKLRTLVEDTEGKKAA